MSSNFETFQRVNNLRKHLNEVNDFNKQYYYQLHNITNDVAFQGGINKYCNQTNKCNLGDYLVSINALTHIANFSDNNEELIKYIESL
jgi:hypothetical protein